MCPRGLIQHMVKNFLVLWLENAKMSRTLPFIVVKGKCVLEGQSVAGLITDDTQQCQETLTNLCLTGGLYGWEYLSAVKLGWVSNHPQYNPANMNSCKIKRNLHSLHSNNSQSVSVNTERDHLHNHFPGSSHSMALQHEQSRESILWRLHTNGEDKYM